MNFWNQVIHFLLSWKHNIRSQGNKKKLLSVLYRANAGYSLEWGINNSNVSNQIWFDKCFHYINGTLVRRSRLPTGLVRSVHARVSRSPPPSSSEVRYPFEENKFLRPSNWLSSSIVNCLQVNFRWTISINNEFWVQKQSHFLNS